MEATATKTPPMKIPLKAAEAVQLMGLMQQLQEAAQAFQHAREHEAEYMGRIFAERSFKLPENAHYTLEVDEKSGKVLLVKGKAPNV